MEKQSAYFQKMQVPELSRPAGTSRAEGPQAQSSQEADSRDLQARLQSPHRLSVMSTTTGPRSHQRLSSHLQSSLEALAPAVHAQRSVLSSATTLVCSRPIGGRHEAEATTIRPLGENHGLTGREHVKFEVVAIKKPAVRRAHFGAENQDVQSRSRAVKKLIFSSRNPEFNSRPSMLALRSAI